MLVGRPAQFSEAVHRARVYLRTFGPYTFARRLLQPWRWLPRLIGRNVVATTSGLDDQYEIWLRNHTITGLAADRIRADARSLAYRPLISVIVPVFDPSLEWLNAAIESVRGQYYDNWQLCLADDCSHNAAIREVLRDYAASDGRIRIVFLDRNHGISAASNAALALAEGEFVAFLDHDDELKLNALYEIAVLLNQNSDLDLIYTDEDKRDPNGRLVQPFFKPDWSPDLLLSMNYVCHLAVYRRALVTELAGLRSEYDFSQDHDLLLRFSELTQRIAHIPQPLYTWRMLPGSTARNADAKPAAREATINAITAALQRRGIAGRVAEGLWTSTYRVRYEIHDEPLVSIIVLARKSRDAVVTCVTSVLERTRYKNYELLLVEDPETEAESLAFLGQFEANPRVRVLKLTSPLNSSALSNYAVGQALGEHILLLDSAIEVVDGGWLEAMVEHSQHPEVGAVGARLLYPDGRVQHGGLVLGIGGVAGHAHKHFPRDDIGYFFRAVVSQNFSAVTGTCLLMRRELYLAVGGLNAKELAAAFSDVDLCLRLREKGLLVVWTPYAELVLHESVNRAHDSTRQIQASLGSEMRYMHQRWGDLLTHDPYYNPNLTLEREDFSLIV